MKSKTKIIAASLGLLLLISFVQWQDGRILGAVLQTGDYLYNSVTKENSLGKYAPTDLIELDHLGARKKHIRSIVYPDLVRMMDQSKKDGSPLSIISAYRSYQTQASLYAYYKKHFSNADKFSAPSQHSEHQLGTVVDFGSGNSRVDLTAAYAKTRQGQWLSSNAWKYGFVLSYPKGAETATGYIYEPWHYRYIGVGAAEVLHDSGMNAYDFFPSQPQYIVQPE